MQRCVIVLIRKHVGPAGGQMASFREELPLFTSLHTQTRQGRFESTEYYIMYKFGSNKGTDRCLSDCNLCPICLAKNPKSRLEGQNRQEMSSIQDTVSSMTKVMLQIATGPDAWLSHCQRNHKWVPQIRSPLDHLPTSILVLNEETFSSLTLMQPPSSQ